MKRTLIRLLIIATIVATGPQLAVAQDDEVSPYGGAEGWKETYEERVAWFKDAKFGMFIHWGLYSAAGGYWPPEPDTGKRFDQHYAEWIRNWARVPEPEYGKTLKPLFTPKAGCTQQWADLAKKAGMKYAVLTAKHHEGYTLFNSDAKYSQANDQTNGTNISPAGRDLFSEYADSMRSADVKPGFYYSIIDWQHPSAYDLSRPFPVPAGADHDQYVDYMSGQLDELASNYGELAVVWIDYSNAKWQGSTWKTSSNLTNLLRKQPHIITNNRWWNDLSNRYGDYFSPEKWVPTGNQHDQPFEVCHTMNESFGFSYHDDQWKSSADVIKLLCDIVGKGGNLLLNVGPDRFGAIPEPCVSALTEVGEWVEANEEAIYGTFASPFRYYDFGGCCSTRPIDSGTRLYVHLFSPPESGAVTLTGLQNDITSVKLLAEGKKLTFDSDMKSFEVPKSIANDSVVVVCVDLQGECKVENDSAVNQRSDRSIVMPAARAELEGPNIRLEQSNQNIGWWTSADAAATFTFNATRPESVQHLGGSVKSTPGVYDLIMTIGVDGAAGGTMVATLNSSPEQQVNYQVTPTGGWHSYQPVTIGKITLDEARTYSLTVKASSLRRGGFMNLREVRLQPVETPAE